ncbi:MAG: succinate CoA transferase [Bryobacter sp.]|nr:succinate CoA transferase [Bryobacter sp.]
MSFPVLAPAEAAELIAHGARIGFSGFTPAGSAKAIPRALAVRAESEHAAGRPFRVGVLTGASTGPSLDGALAAALAIQFRTPYQSDPLLRKQINSGEVEFVDLHLSTLPQALRYGHLGKLDWAVVEVAEVSANGEAVLTTSVGASNTYLRSAERVLLEVNRRAPAALRGFHDLFEPEDPPTRRELPIFNVEDRAGLPVAQIPPEKIAGVVYTDEVDECGSFGPATEVTARIGAHIADFLAAERLAGRIPNGFLPLQSGVGEVANSVLAALGAHPYIPVFAMYTEVLQDSVLELLLSGRIRFASTSALTLSPASQERFFAELEYFRPRVVLRPQEISNHPEIVRRLGLISLNTAIEFDLCGNVNSTHVLGRNLMNGLGGSGDFTRNAYLSIFSCASTTKGGAISTVVPLVSHCDHNEHSVQVVVTEQGVADLRGLDPWQRARRIIERCAHPNYREGLLAYLAQCPPGHQPLDHRSALSWHERFAATGTMLAKQDAVLT